MKKDLPHILLVNPWIHDFAAYDFWAKPMGLLMLAALLRQHEIRVSYIDCLDRFHPKAPQSDPLARCGRGPYRKSHINKPKGLDDVCRNFSRYGISPQWFTAGLQACAPPDLILVTSLMTYWYGGVQAVIGILKHVYPDTPVVLGGVYASLCRAHAIQYSGADDVVTGPAETKLLPLICQYTGFSADPKFIGGDLDSYPYPALDLQSIINYVPLLTSRGCPFRCAYCASSHLNPGRMLRSAESVVEEINYWHSIYGVIDFVLYDDAFLVDAEDHAIPIMEKIITEGLQVRFHTPNALHIRGITRRTAGLMFRAGFKTLRLGLETTEFDRRKEIDTKVTEDEFRRVAECLKKAGFHKDQVGAYLLAGLPGQSLDSIGHSIQSAKKNGITPIPAYYSPIPHTALWDKAVAASRYDLQSDPIFTNNAILPCRREPFSWEMISHLKALARAA